jgi:hypothetical protein
MTKDVRRGDLELLPLIFQAFVMFEHQIALYRLMEPKSIDAWKDNRDHLLASWDGLAGVVAGYAATCPELDGKIKVDIVGVELESSE